MGIIFLQFVGLLFGGSMVRLMATSSKRAYATLHDPGLLQPEPLPLRQATADPYLHRRLKHRSGSVSVGSLGPGAQKVLFEPSEHLWWGWGLILNAALPLLPSCWAFSFALGYGVSFFGGIQHFPLSGCSAASFNFGVLAGGNEHMSF